MTCCAAPFALLPLFFAVTAKIGQDNTDTKEASKVVPAQAKKWLKRKCGEDAASQLGDGKVPFCPDEPSRG